MNPTPEKTSVMAPFILMLFLYFIVGLFTVINQQLRHIYAPSYITIMGNPIFTGFFVFLSGSSVTGIAVTILQKAVVPSVWA